MWESLKISNHDGFHSEVKTVGKRKKDASLKKDKAKQAGDQQLSSKPLENGSVRAHKCPKTLETGVAGRGLAGWAEAVNSKYTAVKIQVEMQSRLLKAKHGSVQSGDQSLADFTSTHRLFLQDTHGEGGKES